MKNINHKNVLITGGASGIGRVMALLMAREGARLIIWDINREALRQIEQDIKKRSGQVNTYYCDVSQKEHVYQLAGQVKKECGKVDILINNAGIVSGKKISECSDEMIIKTMNINILAHFWTVKAFLPDMLAQNLGHIVTISSAAGLMGVAGLADYCASKFAVFGLNEAVRMELKRKKIKGVKTTLVCPFYINTGMFDGVKTRFPLLLPILDEKKAAQKIISAIKKNKPELKMPWLIKLVALIRLLPVPLMDKVVSWLGISHSMDEFRGHS